MLQSIRKKVARFFGGDNTVVCWGRFTTAGTGAITVNEGQGVASIARTGVGVFVITFPFTWQELSLVLGHAGTTDAVTFRESARSPSARTVTITAYASGGTTATEQTGPVCNFIAVARL